MVRHRNAGRSVFEPVRSASVADGIHVLARGLFVAGGRKVGQNVVMNPDVRSRRVEPEGGDGLTENAAQTEQHAVEVQVGEAGCLDLFSEAGDRLAGPGVVASERSEERIHLVDREVGASVDEPVRRMLEVVLDHIVGQQFERLGCHGSPGDVAQIVVAPQ